MFLFFCAPALAQSSQGFKSTSAYQINASVQASAVNAEAAYQPYRSTIYQPFSESAPTNNNPSDGSSGVNGRRNANVGIPSWGGTMSEPLPIGDSTPLFWLAAAMIAMIAIRQRRKQKQLTTQTSNNHSNNDTNEMTLTQHTSKSFRKLLMLALLLCIVGEASADKTDTALNKKQNAAAAATKTIYFRPSTVCIDGGYTYTGGSGSNIAWVRYGSSSRRYFIVEKLSNSSTPTYHAFTKTLEILPNGTTAAKATKSRFLSATLSTTSSFSCYRVYNLTTDEDNAKKIDITQAGSNSTISGKVQNCIPNNEWWLGNGAHGQTWTSKLISVADMGDKNLVAIQEGYWGGGNESSSTKKGYYFGYYLENDAHIYFENKNDWSAPTFLRGKDIYAYSHAMTKIDSTNLYYCKLAAPTSDVESGIAYTDYAFISKATTKGYDVNNEDVLLWKRWPHATDNATDLAFSSKDDNSFDKLRKKSGYSYTGALSNKLSGTYNLFIPGSANDAAPTQVSLTDQKSLNQEHTFIVETGGKINMYVHALDYYTNIVSNSPRTDITGTRNENVVYTSTVWLSAHPNDGYDFIGWYEKDNLGNLARLSTASQYHYEVERTNRTIVAKFADKKKFRMQIFENKDDLNIYDKNDWTDSNLGGTLTIQYTKTDGTTNTETIDAVERSKDDIHPEKTLTITATPKDGYTFVGFWNNTKGQIFGQNPWSMTPKDQDEPVTARFAKTFTQKVNAYTYNTETDVFDAKGTNGGSVSIVYPKIAYTKEGCEKATATTTGEWSDNVLAEKTTMTITASAADGYKFLGWYSTAGEPIDWMNQEGAKVNYTANAAYTIVARFHKPFSQAFDVQTEISGQYQNSTTGGTATISYNNTTTNITDQLLTISNVEQGTMVELNATPKDGYRFVGWFQNDGTCWTENPYKYRAEGARTLHARFARNDVQLVVAVMNYNTDYADFVEYPHDNNTVTISNGGNTTTVTSSTSAVINYGTQVTLTATNDPHQTEGYDFIGWYQNNQRISTSKTYTFTITDHSAISAHFAPKQCHKVIIKSSLGGTYNVKYAREGLFDQEGMYYIATSQYDKDIEIHVPYEALITVINPQSTIGYNYRGYKVTKGINNNNTYTIDESKYNKNDPPIVAANFVRTDEQVIYLDISNKDKTDSKWNGATEFGCNLRTSFASENNCQPRTATFEKVTNTLYKLTIQANAFEYITIVDAINNNLVKVSSLPQAIPATRYNCFKLNSYKSSTGEWVDAWTTLDTEDGDYRLIYIEQEVTSKTEITRTYEFNEGDRIKKVSSGTKTDIVSLHIYNKVSKDNNGNLTGTALNNPEIILQQWSESAKQWVDVERHMVFGPLQTDNADHIRMPGRKNTAPNVVIDRGIDIIKAQKEDAKEDYGSGVWNFYITQENGNVRLELDKTKKYTGKYYIRTTNADGQYNNFTHPNNEMTFSEYAKKNSDFSHYFVRYIDIYEDGTPTATAGKHPVVKFTISNEHAMFLCKEFMINNNRFTDDEYGDDLFVKNVDGAPNLPADATVRFGWDIITNRLTRAYIANTDFKNNEYLIVDGDKIGDVSGEKAYFDEIGDHFYQIDLNAQVPSDIKVKAKMNGKYQYFMGSENATDKLIGGKATGSYPVRLLYDFKNDRFITICELEGTINGNVNLETSVMIVREHNDAPSQLTFNNDASITATPNVPNTGEDQYTKPAYAVMTFLEDKLLDNNVSKYEKMFYWVSFPFSVKIEDVFGLGDYGYYWIMQYYDGAQRALNGLAQTNWKYITDTEAVLEPNKGYIICLNYSQILQDQLFKSHGAGEFGHSKLSLYFPSLDMISPADIKNQSDVTVTLDQHPRGNTAWNHWDWHIIGVPSFANPEFKKIENDIPFLYKYWHPGDAYAAVSINDVDFWSMHSYMVQYAGKITWQSVVNATPKSLVARTDEDADKKIMLRLELQQAGSTIDKTYVQLRDDKGTLGFDMSLDLTKIINAGANIYSIVDNHEMAGNAIPKEESIIPLGVVITAAGEYTFAMPNGTEGMMVELIDYEQGTCTNLLVSNYTANMPVGTNNTRFALRLKPDKVATNVEDIHGDSNDTNTATVRKLLIDGVLYLQQGNNTYDAQGKLVK